MNRNSKVIVSRDFPQIPSKQPYIKPAESNMGIQMHVGMVQDPRLQNKMGAKMSGIFNGGKYMDLALGNYENYMVNMTDSNIPWPRNHNVVPSPQRFKNQVPRGTAFYQNKYAADGVYAMNKEHMKKINEITPVKGYIKPIEVNIGYPNNHAGRVDIDINSALQPCSNNMDCINKYQYMPPHKLERSKYYQSLNDLPQRTHFNFYYDDVKQMRLYQQ